MELVRFDHACHRFLDGNYGINKINLRIDKGDFIVITGRNGAGKTVLMKHANGLLLPTEGEVYFLGRPVRDQQTKVKEQIGFIFQNPDTQIVCPTVEEELAFGPENLGLTREIINMRIKETIELMELEHLMDKRTSVLSGGEKRKLTIAAILTMKPEMIILDEPFIGLDYPGIKEVLEQILRLHTAGHTVVIITHEIEKVLAHANRLVIIDNGEIAAEGKPGELIAGIEAFGIKNPLHAYQSWKDLTWLS